jgi:hypothetical protein
LSFTWKFCKTVPTTSWIATKNTATNNDNNDGQRLKKARATAQIRGDGTTEEISISSDEKAQISAE